MSSPFLFRDKRLYSFPWLAQVVQLDRDERSLLLPVRLGLRFRRLTNFFRFLSFPCSQTLTCSNLEEDTLNVDPTRRQSLRPAKTRQASSGFFVKYQLVTRKDQAIIFCQTSLSFLTNKKIFFAGRTEYTTAHRVIHSRKVLR